MDITILLALQSLRSDWLSRVFLLLTQCAEQLVLLAVICVIYWCISKRTATMLMLNFFAGTYINQLLKITCVVPRPWLRDARVLPVPQALETATGYSFPSGHTANAVAAYGGLAMAQKRRAWKIAAAVLIALIGFSRCYLGVHTPQDVLTSLAAGIALLIGVKHLTDALEAHPQWDVPLTLTGIALSVRLALYAAYKPYPAGADPLLAADAYKAAAGLSGILIGWLMERRLIGFDPKSIAGCTRRASVFFWQVLKAAVGLGITVAIMTLSKAPLNQLFGLAVGSAVRYFVVALFISAGYPALFQAMRRWTKMRAAKRAAVHGESDCGRSDD